MGPVEDVGLRIGMALTLVTAGVIAGPPISGAIVDNTGSFKNVGYYGGTPLSHHRVVVGSEPLCSDRRFYAVVIGRTYGCGEAFCG